MFTFELETILRLGEIESSLFLWVVICIHYSCVFYTSLKTQYCCICPMVRNLTLYTAPNWSIRKIHAIFFHILKIKYWKNTFEKNKIKMKIKTRKNWKTKKKLNNKMHKLNTKTSWICSMISPYKNYNSKIIGCAFNCAEYVVMEKKESYNIFVWTIIIVCLCSSNIDCFCFSFWILCLFRILWRGTHQLFKGSLILAFVYFEHIVYKS